MLPELTALTAFPLAAQEIVLLPELLALSVGAIVAVLVLRRLRLPVIAGMLVAGALVGPAGFHFVSSGDHLAAFAEIGVALLLFTIGLEFNRERLANTGTRALVAGVEQIVLTLAAAAGIALAVGMTFTQAVYVGMVVSLSSTAIVLRALTDRAELDAPHGRLVLATLIVQDLAIVPMLILVPILAGGAGNPWATLGMVALKAGALIGIAILAARYLIPWLMKEISAVASRDVFLLTVLTLGLGLSWLTMAAGLSPALGAFIAGIMLADSEYAHHTLSEVLPVRDLFFSFFFITMGMLFDWRFLVSHPLPVLGILALLLVGKGLIAALSVLLLRFPARIAILFGLGLAQFGEFGYLLLKSGKVPFVTSPLLESTAGDILLCAGLLSMFLTPLILMLAPHISAGEALLRPLERLLRVRGIDEPESVHASLSAHVVIGGFGPAGRLLAGELKARGTPYIVLEMNSETVRRMREEGEPVYYGDVTSREALEHAGLGDAAAVVLSFHDRRAVERAITIIRQIAPRVAIIVRVPFASLIAPLKQLGATAVVAGEIAAGMAVAQSVLTELDARQAAG